MYFLAFRDTNRDTLSPCAPKHVMWQRVFRGANEFKVRNLIYSERVTLQFMCVGCWAGVTYLRYTVPTSHKKGETTVHCCDPTLSFLVMLMSRNVFHVVSALQSIVCLHTFFWLIRSLVDPTLAALIVCGPLQFLVSIYPTLFMTKTTEKPYPLGPHIPI